MPGRGSHTGLRSCGTHDGVSGGGGAYAGVHGCPHDGRGGIGRPSVAGRGDGGGLHSSVAGFHTRSFWHGDEWASGVENITTPMEADATRMPAMRRQRPRIG